MKNFKGRIFILILFLIAFLLSLSGNQAGKYQNKEILLKDYLEETHLFTDRDIYIAGEKLWFSTYINCLQDTSSQCLSHVLFVELYHESEPYTIQQKFKIVNGQVSASLIIPEDFLTGNYYLQVYTNYQKSSLPVDFTRKEILILNPKRKMILPVGKLPARFFFKDGYPVYNKLTQGVVAINSSTRKARYATLIADKKDTIDNVIWLKNRLGIFHFTPKEGVTYEARIKFDDGDSLVLPIDQINSSCAELVTQMKLSTLAISIDSYNLRNNTPCKLLIKDRLMNTLYIKEFPLVSEMGTLKVDNRLLSDGINYIILKDKSNRLICMDVLYPELKKPLPINIKTDLQQYKPGEKIHLSLDASDNIIGGGAQLTVSVALKGSVTNCDGIVKNDKLSDALAIIRENGIIQDMNMLNKLLSDESNLPIEHIPDIRDVSLTGMLTNDSDIPVANTDVYLSVLGDEPQLHIYNTNEDGSFVFSLNNFHGNKKIYTGTNNIKPVKIKINNDFADKYYPLWNSLSFTRDESQLYDKLYIDYQVTNYYIQTAKLKKPDDYIPQPVFSNPDYTVNPSDFIALSSLEEIFKEIVPNVFAVKNKGNYHFEVKVTDQDRLIQNPLVMLNNIPVFNYKQLLDIHPSSVRKIDVINQEYFLGSHKLNGVINLEAAKSELEEYKFPEGTVFFNYQTLTPGGSFNIPEVKLISDRDKPLPWFANLIYWNADISLGKHPVTRDFISGDNEGDYEIHVKGISSDGTPVCGFASFKIRKK